MKKKLVFLALVLVLCLGCVVAANAVTLKWTNNGEVIDYDATKIVAGDKIQINGVEYTITKAAAIHEEPTCTTAAQWKIFYEDKTGTEVFVIGWFDQGVKRAKSGHVWYSAAGATEIKSITFDADGNATIIYKDGSTKVLGIPVIKLPTCSATGTGTANDFCIYCGKANGTTTVTVAKLPHNYSEKLLKWPDCTKYADGEWQSVYKCDNCGEVQVGADSKPVIVRSGTGVASIKALGSADPIYKDYVAKGYDIDTGHKWDGWAPGKTACIKQCHCLICDVTKEKVSASKPIVLSEYVVNCYWIAEVRQCAVCNGATTDPAGTISKEKHEKHTAYVYAGTIGDAKYYDTMPEGPLEYVEDRGDLTKYASHIGPLTFKKYIAADGVEYDKKQYTVANNFCLKAYTEKYYCEACKETVLVAHGPDGHDFNAWVMNYAPGAGDNVEGEWNRVCKKCGATEKYHGTTAPAANYVADVADTENGLQFKYGKWGWYKDGALQYVNTLVPYMGAWFKVADGVLDSSFEGLYSYDGAWFYISGGQVRNDLQGFVNTKSGFYYFADGMLQSQATTLVQYDGAWFYIVNGVLAADYTGPVTYDGAVFNVVNGQVQF